MGYPFVSFCVNDPDNGELTNEITRLEVSGPTPGDLAIQVEGQGEYAEDGCLYRVLVAGAWFALKSDITPWVGNLCWNGARMHPGTLARLLNHLRRQGWDCDEADERLMTLWDSGFDVTEETLEEVLELGTVFR